MLQTVSANHLLWALCFLKTYQPYSVLSSLVGGVDEKTYKEWVWSFVVAISELKQFVIKWDKRLKGDVGYECLVSVDGTDFRIPQQSPFSSAWFSHKFNGPGLRYEVGVSIIGGSIVWIN